MGIDAGTSGVRVLVVDPDGTVRGRASRAWRAQNGSDGFPSLDLEAVWAAVTETAREAVAAGGPVSAVGVTSQRHSVVLLDKEGRALGVSPNIDFRGLVPGLAAEHRHGDEIFAATGHLPVFHFPAARLAWFRDNNAEAWERAAMSMGLGDWIAYRLSNEWATDPVTASETLCYDISSGAWSERLCELLGIAPSLLPPVVTGASGSVTPEASEQTSIPAGAAVVRAGGDTHCAALAMGATEPGSVTVSAGMTMLVHQVVPAPLRDRRLWTTPHLVPGRWALEAHCWESGPALDWLVEFAGATYDWLDEAAAQTQPGAGGVVHVDSAPTNLGNFPIGRTGAFGFPVPLLVLGRSRNDFARATLEGICYAARSAMEWLSEVSGLEARDVALCGGVARLREFPSMLATVLHREVRFRREPESSALGAAVAAAGAGASAMCETGAIVQPEEFLMSAYDAGYQAWSSMRSRLDQGIRVSDLAPKGEQ